MFLKSVYYQGVRSDGMDFDSFARSFNTLASSLRVANDLPEEMDLLELEPKLLNAYQRNGSNNGATKALVSIIHKANDARHRREQKKSANNSLSEI